MLKRAMKVAEVAKQQAAASGAARAALETGHVQMMVEILEQYIYFFERGLEGFTAHEVQPIVDAVLASVASESKESEAAKQWQRTLKGIEQSKTKAEGDVKARWATLSLFEAS